MLNVIAFAIAAIGITIILPYFSDLTGIPLERLTFIRPLIWISAIALYLFGSLIVGVFTIVDVAQAQPCSNHERKCSPLFQFGKAKDVVGCCPIRDFNISHHIRFSR